MRKRIVEDRGILHSLRRVLFAHNRCANNCETSCIWSSKDFSETLQKKNILGTVPLHSIEEKYYFSKSFRLEYGITGDSTLQLIFWLLEYLPFGFRRILSRPYARGFRIGMRLYCFECVIASRAARSRGRYSGLCGQPCPEPAAESLLDHPVYVCSTLIFF